MTKSRGIYKPVGRYVKPCTTCSKDMAFTHYCKMVNRQFCSKRCSALRNSGPEVSYTVKCKQCGRNFVVISRTGSSREYCSRICLCRSNNARHPGSKGWTEEEDNILKRMYPISLMSDIRSQLSRTTHQINKRAKQLSLTRTDEATSADYASGGRRNKGRKRPDLAKNRFVAKLGSENHFFGRTHTEETRKIISDKARETQTFARLSKDPEFQRKRMVGLHARPNKPETIICNILDQILPGEYRYTGDGTFVIDGLSPDFTGVRTNKVIEVFGETYHDPSVSPRPVAIRSTEVGRRKALAESGYDLLVIWSKEIFRGGAEGRIKLGDKIRRFHENSSY